MLSCLSILRFHSLRRQSIAVKVLLSDLFLSVIRTWQLQHALFHEL